jgi:hypothetical protein
MGKAKHTVAVTVATGIVAAGVVGCNNTSGDDCNSKGQSATSVSSAELVAGKGKGSKSSKKGKGKHRGGHGSDVCDD